MFKQLVPHSVREKWLLDKPLRKRQVKVLYDIIDKELGAVETHEKHLTFFAKINFAGE